MRVTGGVTENVQEDREKLAKDGEHLILGELVLNEFTEKVHRAMDGIWIV